MSNIDLQLGDCFEGLKSIPDHSIDCIVTDPPYGNTQCDFDYIIDEPTLLKEFKRIIKPNRAVCIFCEARMLARLIAAQPEWYRYTTVWVKTIPTGFLDCNRRPLRRFELISVFSDKSPLYNPQYTYSTPYSHKRQKKCQCYAHNTPRIPTINKDGKRYPTDVIFCNSTKRVDCMHPTQKPAELIEYLIRTYSNAGDVILDPFAGSGTTAVAAINSDRSFIGWERDEGYYNAAIKRIETAKITKAETLPIDYD